MGKPKPVKEHLLPYSVLITLETKKRLRMHCLANDTTAPVVIRKLIDDYLANNPVEDRKSA